MLFSTPLFVWLFLPIVLGVYFAVRRPLRNPWLLLSSLFFYAWGEKLLVAVMLLTIVSNWAFGFWIDRAPTVIRDFRVHARPLLGGGVGIHAQLVWASNHMDGALLTSPFPLCNAHWKSVSAGWPTSALSAS